MKMRDERNYGSAGKNSSPSAKRRRGRRLKSSSQSNRTHTTVSNEVSSNQFLFRVRRSERDARRYRHRSASSTEGSGKSLITSVFRYESSNQYLPSNRRKLVNEERDHSVRRKSEPFKVIVGDKDSRRLNQKSHEFNRLDLKYRIINNCNESETTLVNKTPLTTDLEPVVADKNLEDAKVSDILKSVMAREYKPVPARPSNPLRYKTELCRAHDEGGFCRFGMFCTFAHGQEELRAVPRHHKYKTEPCRSYHSIGYCQYGARCHFVHDPEDGVTLKQTTMAASLPQLEAGSSVKNLFESICIEENFAEKDALVNIHDLDYLEDKPEDFMENDLDFTPLPEVSLSPIKKAPSFMDYLLQSQGDGTKDKNAESSAVKSDQYFESLDTLSENPDALFSSECYFPRLSQSTLDESWWKDIPSLSRLNWLESDDLTSAKASTRGSLFPSLGDKDTITKTPSLSSAVSRELLTDLAQRPLDTRL